MDIVDAQVHVGRGGIETTLHAMDALGITAVLIDELWGALGTTHPTHLQPGFMLEGGAWRTAFPTAEEASLHYPDRFSYLVRIDPRDPELESVMRTVASSPHARAFRLQPVWTLDEAAAFAGGSFDAVLDIAQDLGMPVCFFIPGYAELLAPYARRFDRLTFIVDHCGMGFPGIPAGRSAADEARTRDPGYFDSVLRLAELPNVALKWSHAQDRFSERDYPYPNLRPHLRKAISAFGAERILWASDHTVLRGLSWGDILYSLRDDPELDATEKAWILGMSARKLLKWPGRPASGD